MKQSFCVTGMSCAACASHVEKAVQSVEGVKSVSVQLLLNRMTVDFDNEACKAEDIIRSVVSAGYGASLIQTETAPQTAPAQTAFFPSAEEEIRGMKTRLFSSLCFLVPLLWISMGRMLGLPQPGFLSGQMTNAIAQLLLCLPVAMLNRKSYTVGLRALKNRAPTMDSLIAVGSGASLLSGIFAVLRMSQGLERGDEALVAQYANSLYFESAAMILTLITLGKLLETRSRGRTGEAISRLIALTPQTACVLREGEEREIPVSEVRAGDLVVVRAGQRVPVDGILCEGSASIDESALTGESIPVEKLPGDRVDAGTVCENGFFRVTVDRVGQDTALSRMIALVEEASAGKAPIARLADKISGVFVPVVMGIAGVTFLIWMLAGKGAEFSLQMAISVLVISCPCALGLATPVAIMAGTGKGAEHGILFRTAEALERAQAIDTVILDKTGTVTQGEPSVTDLLLCRGTAEELLSLASSVEASSTHPLAKAICRQAEGLSAIPVSQVENLPGLGLKARAAGHLLLAGNAALLEKEGVCCDFVPAEPLEQAGKTLLYFARDGALQGVIAVADPVKPDSAQAVAALREMGCRVLLLTGDRARTAEAVCQAVGAEQAIAQVLPSEKEAVIRSLQQEGRTVAMVGDGINDAPALARAEIGLAIGGGTDIAVEAADVVLTGKSLFSVVNALRLSKKTVRIIRQNLFWALFYNSIGIPIAAGVLYPAFGLKLSPMIGAAAMSFSSVTVVTNALRLTKLSLKRSEQPSFAQPVENRPQIHTFPAPDLKKEESHVTTKTMKVQGMMCKHCVAHVQNALQALPGVTAEVDLAKGCAVITTDGSVTDAQLLQAVCDAGYEASFC